MTAVLPPFAHRREVVRAYRHPLVFVARDLSLVARSGQEGTFTRATTGAADDSFAVARTCNYGQPRWHSRSSIATLRMGSGVTEYLTWAVPAGVGAMSFLFDFIENGTLASAGRALWSLTNAAGGTPRLYVSESGGKYAAVHQNGAGTVSSTMTGTAPVNGDRVRLRVHLLSTGSIQIWQSINGAAETTPGASGTQTVNAWASTTLFILNALGTGNIGITDWIGAVMMAGSQSQAKLLEALV